MSASGYLAPNQIYQGDARALLAQLRPESVSLSFWSPPYFVGKSYETELDFPTWSELLRQTIDGHFVVIAPGGFLAVNIADILAFEDPDMPRIQADNVSAKKVKITREQVLAAQQANPGFDKYRLAALLGCSEQTIDRRLKNNNVRGGKYTPQTRVQLTAGLVEQWASEAGFYLYDRRIWVKDPCWENSRWHSLSYRAVDEFEHILIFWKPGITVVNRERLDAGEWAEWGSRAVWNIPSVRSNSDHESQFPLELPRRMVKLLTEADDLVLDCFVGSGTTALAAIEQGRQFLGFDLSPNSVKLATRRTAEAFAASQLLLL
ncbi:MAG: site-specific DNA-methyltransferase [Dehalococcoidia bacterium]|nr:site-specific DNA-methyltransferase [Dehalococcoidia bacterium]